MPKVVSSNSMKRRFYARSKRRRIADKSRNNRRRFRLSSRTDKAIRARRRWMRNPGVADFVGIDTKVKSKRARMNVPSKYRRRRSRRRRRR